MLRHPVDLVGVKTERGECRRDADRPEKLRDRGDGRMRELVLALIGNAQARATSAIAAGQAGRLNAIT